jgi:hypothetical protein
MRLFERFDIQHELYEKGFSRSDLQARRPYRIAAALLAVLALVAGQFWSRGSSVWGWVFGACFIAAMYAGLRASQRSSTSRTLRAALAFIVGLLLVVWTYWGVTRFSGQFGLFTTVPALVLSAAAGATLLVVAARLSRRDRAA